MARFLSAAIATLVVVAAVAVALPPAPAAADTAFAPVFSINAPGDIEYVANTVATCSAALATCAAAQAGGNSTNNAFGANMVLIDVDGDPTTTTSSTATYTLPAGGSILWAGLYWAGYYTGANDDKDDVKFSTPASGGYVNLTASFFDDWNGNDNYYTGFVDVTTMVQAGGTGTYGVGDIAVTPGSGATYGGWTLIVVEEDPAEPWRNLTVNHGFQFVGSGGVINIPVSGFTAPPVGPIDAEIGVVASEGDIGFAGDYAEFNGTPLTNATNPPDNFFNSSLTNNAVYNGGLNPSYPANTLGFDADIIETSGLVPPGSTTATVTIGTDGDGFFPTAVTTNIDIYVPNLTVNFEKESTDLNGEQVHPGDVIQYNLSFDNTGDDPSIETTLADVIPAGTTYVPGSLTIIEDDSPVGGRTDAAGDDTAWFDGSAVNFNVGVGATAAVGGEVAPLSQGGHGYEVSYQVTVDPGTEGTDIVNQAQLDYIAKFINEPFSADSNTTTDPVEPLVDLTIDKVDLSDPVLAGEQLTYEVTIENEGPSVAQNVTITDTLPVGTTFDASLSDPACSVTAAGPPETVTCTYPSLAAGDSETPSIVVDVDGALTVPNICNPASVTSDTHEHDLDDNLDRECTDVEREVDLVVEKTGPATVVAGNQLTYNVAVSNDGPSDAQNVSVTDSLPSGATLVSATPSGSGSCDATPTCTWPSIADGGTETIVVVVAVPPSATAGTTLENRVDATSDDPEGDPSNNTDTVETTVVTEADLAVDKTTLTSPVVAGGTISYDISVTNNGPSDAQAVTVTDAVPTGLTFDASLSSSDCTLSVGTITCAAGTVADGATESFTLVFDVDSDLADGATIENTAEVSSTTDDPDSSNDTGETTDTVERQADLSIVKDDNATTIVAGTQITYTLTYQNEGPSDASGVVITDTLPVGATFSSSSDCTESGGTVTCAVGAIPAGTGGSVSFVVDTDSSLADTAQLLNPASISGDETDPDLLDNDSEVTTDIDRDSELRIAKDDLSDPVLAGQTVTYRIEVENLGPSDDSGVTLTDALPAGLTFDSTDDPTNCAESGGTVTCTIGVLAAGDTYVVEITAIVGADLADGTIISNTASASGDVSPQVDDTEETTVDTAADLQMTKTGPATAVAGNQVTYTVSVYNDGPSDAQAVEISDTLPGGTSFDSATVTAGTATCTDSGAMVTCTTATLAAGATVTVDITVTIDPATADATLLTNTATVGSDTPDGDPSNDSDDVETTVGKEADLVTAKSTLTSPILAGGVATFSVTVTNDGPSTATNISVDDDLPAGFTFNSALSDSACVAGTAPADVTCSAATLAVGAPVTFTIVADVDPGVAAATYTNEATAAADETDPDPGNNDDSADIEVGEEADLEIIKEADAPSLVPGTTGTYTITVINNGPSDALNVVVNDVLPPELSFNPAGSSASCAAGVVCTLGTIPPSGQVVLTLVVDVAADASGPIGNTATVSSPTPDPDPDNDESTDTVPALPQADLSLTKTAPATAVAGETVTYSFTVTNDGPSDAAGTVVTDTLPAGLSFQPTGSSPQCTSSNATVTCNLGTLTPGQVVNLTVVADVASSVPDGTSIENDASVESDATDPDPSNNDDSAQTEVDREADLSIDKAASSSTVVAGSNATFTLTVSNAGPSDASNVVVADTLPTGMTITGVNTTDGTCSGIGTNLGCSILAVAAGDTVTITVDVDIDSSVANNTILTNTAQATSSDPDPDPSNNEDSVDVTVAAEADLRLAKTATPNPVVAGQTVTYVLTVTNDGPSDALAVSVTDTLPTGLTIDSVTSPTMTCGDSGQTATCTQATLVDGGTAVVTVVADVDPEQVDGSTLTNNASVSSDTDDPDPLDNGDSVDVDVEKAANIALAKSTTKPVLVAGEFHPYQLTISNAGPSSATSVVVTDTIPAGTTFNPALSDSSCSAAGTTVTCLVPLVAASGSLSLNIVVDVPADFPDGGAVTNSASVSADENDPDPTDNDDDVETPVENSADLSIVKDGSGFATAGLPYTWNLAIENAGPSDAENVVVTDTLPVGTTFDAVSSDSRCTAADQVLTCVVPTLAALASDTLTIVVDVDSDEAAGSGLLNEAAITSDTDDPEPDNNTSSDTAGVIRDSELDIDKRDLVDPVVAGGPVQWAIEVVNLGPSDADNVTIVDALPVGVTLVGVDNTSNCSTSVNTVSCLFPTIAAGDSETIVVTADVDSSLADPTVLSNEATVDSDSSDPVTATETTTVNRQSDLVMDKTSDGAVVAGTNHVYTLTVTNDGLSDADGVEVSDFLPIGMNFVSSTNPGCSASAGLVTCVLGTIAAGDAVTFDIEVFVTDSAATPTVNSATVTSDSPDPDPANNTDDDETEVTFEADLSLIKRAVTDPAVPGEPMTWEIEVTNAGTSIANNVSVTDSLPPSLTFVPAPGVPSSSTACSTIPAAPQDVTCTEADLLAGETIIFTIVADIDPATVDPIANSASVTSDTPDPDPSNNDGDDTAGVGPEADLSLVKTALTSPAVPGDPISYDVTVTNDGPSDALGIVVTDPVPAGATFDPTTSSANCGLVGSNVVCTVPVVPAGETVSVVIAFILDSDVIDGSTLENQASVTSDTPDPDPSDNTEDEETPVVASADLSVVKSGPSEPVVAGSEFDYTITIENHGPSDAQNAVLVDNLPAGTTLVSVDDGACTGAVSCTYATIPAGASIVVTVTVAVDDSLEEGAVITNDAAVSSDTADPDPSDNGDTNDSTVGRSAGLELTKTAAPQPVVAGEALTYTLSVTNVGPSVSDNVSIVDQLPAGTSFVSASAGCTNNPGATTSTVSCVVGTLGVGQVTDFEITVLVDSATVEQSSLVNEATATGDDSPPSTEGEEVEVDTSADLLITKDRVNDPVAGQELSWVITVANAGPSDALDVVVADALPAGVTYVSDTGGCEASGGAIECPLGTVQAGATESFEVTGLVEPFVSDEFQLANNAAVSSSTPDPDPTNNATSDESVVEAIADLSLEKTLAGELSAGRPAQYELTVTNAGPSDAPGVVVTDDLPVGLSFESADSDPSCIAAGATVTCSLGTVPANGTSSVVVAVNVEEGATGSLTNSASVSGDVADPDPDGNTASVTGEVGRESTLALDKLVDDTSLAPGATASYTIVVDNLGPARATGVVVEDQMPDGLTLVGASVASDSGSCALDGVTVRCDLGSVAVSEPVSVVVTAVAEDRPGLELVNRASVAGDGIDPVVASVTAEIQSDVDGQPPVPIPFLPITGSRSGALFVAAIGLLMLGLTLTAANRWWGTERSSV